MSESSKLTTQIIAHIHARGGFAWRAPSTGIYDSARARFRSATKKGVSDVLGLYKGRLLAIEVKIGKDRLRPEQEGFLRTIEHHGGFIFIAKDFRSFTEWWDEKVIHSLGLLDNQKL